MATLTEEQIAEQLRVLRSDVRESQREIVVRLDRIERETDGQRWRSQLLPMSIYLAAYVAVLVIVVTIVIATRVVISHL